MVFVDNQPKYAEGELFYLKGCPAVYRTWKTIRILGQPYSGLRFNPGRTDNKFYYPVLVNEDFVSVIPEIGIDGNYSKEEPFKPGYFYINLTKEDESDHPILGWWDRDPGPHYTRYTGEFS